MIKKITPVVSGFDPEDFKKTRQSEYSKKLILMYAGSPYGEKRDPSILFDAISQRISKIKLISTKSLLTFVAMRQILRNFAKNTTSRTTSRSMEESHNQKF